jgi:hypothetical protein
MRSDIATAIIHLIIRPILDVIKKVEEALTAKPQLIPVQFIRVSEKFDVVKKLPHKGWVLKPDGE